MHAISGERSSLIKLIRFGLVEATSLMLMKWNVKKRNTSSAIERAVRFKPRSPDSSDTTNCFAFFALTPVIRLNSCVDFNAGSTSSTCAEAADVQVSAPENFKLSSQVGNTLQIQELNRYPNVVNSRHDQSLVHLPGAGVSGILLTARFKSVSASFCFASRSSWQHQVLCGPNRSQT